MAGPVPVGFAGVPTETTSLAAFIDAALPRNAVIASSLDGAGRKATTNEINALPQGSPPGP